MRHPFHKALRLTIALLVAMAVFTPAAASAACASACGGCRMGAIAVAPGTHDTTGAMSCCKGAGADSCCGAPGGTHRISSCSHEGETSRSSVAVQPGETSAFTIAIVAAPAAQPPLPSSLHLQLAAVAHPPGGVADGTRLRI